MTRDDIEEWFETRVPEAIERLPDSSRSVKEWVKVLASNLVEILKEETDEDPDSGEFHDFEDDDEDE